VNASFTNTFPHLHYFCVVHGDVLNDRNVASHAIIRQYAAYYVSVRAMQAANKTKLLVTVSVDVSTANSNASFHFTFEEKITSVAKQETSLVLVRFIVFHNGRLAWEHAVGISSWIPKRNEHVWLVRW
jgi:hypothetical protein